MGNEQLIYLSMASNTIIVRRPSSETLDIGKKIGVTFSRDKKIFIDEQSEEVIKFSNE